MEMKNNKDNISKNIFYHLIITSAITKNSKTKSKEVKINIVNKINKK